MLLLITKLLLENALAIRPCDLAELPQSHSYPDYSCLLHTSSLVALHKKAHPRVLKRSDLVGYPFSPTLKAVAEKSFDVNKIRIKVYRSIKL